MNKDQINSIFTFMSLENISNLKLNDNIFVDHIVSIKDIFSKNSKLICYDNVMNFTIYCKSGEIFKILKYEIVKKDVYNWYEDENISLYLVNKLVSENEKTIWSDYYINNLERLYVLSKSSNI